MSRSEHRKKPLTNRFLSLPLLAGILVFAVVSLMLGGISEDIVNHQPLTLIDAQLSNWLHHNGTLSLTKAMLVFTFFGSTGAVSCIAVAFGLCLIWQRRFRWLAVVVSAVFGGMVLNKLLKYVFHRPRPHFDDPILTLTGYSFPSGHTMMATALYGVLAAYIFTTTVDRRWRLLTVVAAVVLIGLVGFSRMYLGAHYLSDVLAAMAEGLAWLSLCLIAASSFAPEFGDQKNAG